MIKVGKYQRNVPVTERQYKKVILLAICILFYGFQVNRCSFIRLYMLKVYFIHVYFNTLYRCTKESRKECKKKLKNFNSEKNLKYLSLIDSTNRDYLPVCSSQCFQTILGYTVIFCLKNHNKNKKNNQTGFESSEQPDQQN